VSPPARCSTAPRWNRFGRRPSSPEIPSRVGLTLQFRKGVSARRASPRTRTRRRPLAAPVQRPVVVGSCAKHQGRTSYQPAGRFPSLLKGGSRVLARHRSGERPAWHKYQLRSPHRKPPNSSRERVDALVFKLTHYPNGRITDPTYICPTVRSASPGIEELMRGFPVTQQDLREGSLAEMVVRIASARRSEADVVSATSAGRSQSIDRGARPRRTGRLFPHAPRRG